MLSKSHTLAVHNPECKTHALSTTHDESSTQSAKLKHEGIMRIVLKPVDARFPEESLTAAL
jgi:hypothetical protein